MTMPVSAGEQSSLWDMQKLSRIPQSESAENIIASAKKVNWTEVTEEQKRPDGVQAIWLHGPEYKGKPTKFFAWVGVPKKANGKSKVPGMVLVHGGGGTAYAHWVAKWNRLGYAAIAIDTCGRTPIDAGFKRGERHEFAGPGRCDDFANADKPVKDQWPYHAVSAIIIAHSYLRSLEGVDPNRTGLTGISWGGYLTCIAAAVDDRFKIAIPVYGCGFLGENSAWVGMLNAVDKAKRNRWLSLWDPSVYIGTIKTPVLWVAYTNDNPYPMDSLQKSYKLVQNNLYLCILANFGHSHAYGWSRPEIAAFADSYLKVPVKKGLIKVKDQGRRGNIAWVTFKHGRPVNQARFYYTTDSGPWPKRNWKIIKIPLKKYKRRVETKLPEDVKVYYFNLVDDRDLLVSSQHEEL